MTVAKPELHSRRPSWAEGFEKTYLVHLLFKAMKVLRRKRCVLTVRWTVMIV